MEEKILKTADHDEFAILTTRHERVFSSYGIVTRLYSPPKKFRSSAEMSGQQMRDVVALDRLWRDLSANRCCSYTPLSSSIPPSTGPYRRDGKHFEPARNS